jgi:dolichol-phosphate mannosyltransferase
MASIPRRWQSTTEPAIVPDLRTGLAAADATTLLQLSIVIPTYYERENIQLLITSLEQTLRGIAWEAIFVDDNSADGTAELVRTYAVGDRRIRCLRRIGRRGLSSACIEGMLASAAPFVAVMDADMQHDEKILPAMLDLLRGEAADLVVASRYIDGGSTGEWGAMRKRIGRVATHLGRWMIKTELADPMSGFFMLRRQVFEAVVERLSGTGFKILLDIIASYPDALRVVEVPYIFRTRHAGTSKLDAGVAWDFAVMLLDKTVGSWVPVRFVIFSAVGATGLAVHLLALALLIKGMKIDFAVGQSIATLIAMTNNFLINNAVTYRDLRLRGRNLVLGLLAFYLACSVGAIANVGIATYTYQSGEIWWLAGATGAVVGAVWNYAVTSVYTWGNRAVQIRDNRLRRDAR